MISMKEIKGVHLDLETRVKVMVEMFGALAISKNTNRAFVLKMSERLKEKCRAADKEFLIIRLEDAEAQYREAEKQIASEPAIMPLLDDGLYYDNPMVYRDVLKIVCADNDILFTFGDGMRPRSIDEIYRELGIP